MDAMVSFRGCDRDPVSSQLSGPRGAGGVGPLMVSTFFGGVLGRRDVRPLRERPGRPSRT